MIRFDNVAKRYPNGHEGLSGVDLQLAAGEMAFLTGHSGAGKSTLINILTRYYDIDSGTILIDGQDLSKLQYHLRCG